ncbi:MAG: tetraacyldisaccharide 4'-kinase, partial [Bergeyella zoohelcum]|nr:tetraacyldisaccharide 4'-kinase [Bergeyella zoohelcum]
MKRWYLYPFALVYGLVTSVRNWLYDFKILKSTAFRTPIISVGNLSVGGSGKSPMVMYLAELLHKNYRSGVLSRGYGRLTKGYMVTNYESNYKSVGDEAMQLFERFKNKFVIGVSENRVAGAKKLIQDMDLGVLVLDDAMQHRAIKAGFNILMTDYSDPYFQDFILPAGNLRESRSGAKRADIIMVSKCPKILTEEKKQYFLSRINPKPHQKVF